MLANGGENHLDGEKTPLALYKLKKTPFRKSFLKDWAEVDSNHRTLAGTDLQSVAFSHSAIYPH